ncbi:hypothetical protein [Tateyamaria sp.]|uniref:hypothetical protein n=1 Tax=Tateyamaria sp. TaxID=1929288 RepID=UPI003B2281C8
MTNNSKSKDDAPVTTDRKAQLRAISEEFRANVKAENQRLKAERNARRWKAERDPIAYEAQKVAQREEYAAHIATTEGRNVRSYEPVAGETVEERDHNRRARKAAADAARNGAKSQAEKDAASDRKWLARQIKKGATEAECHAGMARRIEDRKHRAVPYENNPEFGQF